MKTRVAVVGATGRVGRAICEYLADRYEVIRVVRTSADEDVGELACRAVAHRPDVLINAAGVAHVERPSLADLDRLERANVELPVALAAAAVKAGIAMIHISSVKASDDRSDGPYAESKRRCDERLVREFADVGSGLIIVRPLALLFPPLDVGKVARLRFLRWWPTALTPTLRVPVLVPSVFLATVETLLVGLTTTGEDRQGVRIRTFEPNERGTLRDLGEAFRTIEPRGPGRA